MGFSKIVKRITKKQENRQGSANINNIALNNVTLLCSMCLQYLEV